MVKPVLVHLGKRYFRRFVGFWLISKSSPYILPDKKGSSCDERTLVFNPHREPVNVLVTGAAENEQPCRWISNHFPEQSSREPMDFKERQGEVFRTEFAGPLYSTLDDPFLFR